MRERSIIISILAISLFVAMTVVAGPQVVMWYRETQGDVFGTSPYALVERIMRENLDPKLCFKFRYPIPALGLAPAPTVGEQRTTCVYLVAQQLKDPSVCVLLMPSDYGIHCIKNTLPPVAGPDIGINCEDRDGKMFCYSSYNALLAHNQDVVIDYTQCERITDVNKRDWCYIGRVRTIHTEKDCSKVILNQDHKDFCMYTLAMKNKDASVCEKIEHLIRRSACGLLLRKW